MYFARQQVLERLTSADLPEGAKAELGPMSTPIGELYRYTLESDSHSVMELRTLQDWFMERKLKGVNGVADVVSFGGEIKQFQVLVDPLKLRGYGLTLKDIFGALSSSNQNNGGGYLKINDEQFIVRGLGLLSSSKDIEGTVIKAVNGIPLRIENVATVKVGAAVRQGIVGKNANPEVVEGIILMRRGENPSGVLKAIKAKLEDLQKELPKGIQIKSVYDRQILIDRALDNIKETIIIGVVLVFGILMLFTGEWILAFIVTIIIPMALLFAFILMKNKGIAANLMSLGAIDFGIIIDGAVVMVESIFVTLAHQHTFYDNSPYIIKAGKTVGKPILFSKAIIILTLLPIFALERIEGRLFSPMALTISFALLGALLYTLTLVPVMAGLMLQKEVKEKDIWLIKKIEDFYLPLLNWSLDNRKKVLIIALAALGISFLIIPFLGTEFMPEVDEGAIWVRATMPVSISIEDAMAIVPKITETIRAFPQIKTTVSQIGRPEDASDPNLQNNTEIFVDLIPKDKWHCTKEQIIEKLDEKLEKDFPGIAFNFSQPIQDNVDEAISGVKGQIAIKLFGSDLDVLIKKAKEISKTVGKIKGVNGLFVDQLTGQPQLTIKVNREAASRYGIKVEDLQSIIETALAGKVATQYIDGEKRFDLLIRLSPEYRADIESIRNLQVDSADGSQHIPIAELATFEELIGAPIIYRENNQRRVAVRFDVKDRDMGGLVAEAQKTVAEKVKLPEGYKIVWSGQFESQERAMNRLFSILPLSLLFIFILLFIAFGSVKNTVLILCNVPFAAIGGILGLFFSHIHLSVSALVGFIALFGVSVQNGVILVSVFNELREKGLPLKESIKIGVKERLRSVIMTAMLASMGLVPAAISSGTGSETQKPLAIVIIFGLISATILVLIVLPTLYSWSEEEKPEREIQSKS